MPVGQRFAYRIDRDAVPLRLSPGWLEFARRNWRAEFQAEEVLATSLWSHINDRPTRRIYSLILEPLHVGHKGMEFDFRCDSPSLRRLMRMEIAALPLGEVEFLASMVREEPREPQVLLEPDRQAGQYLVSMCGWCKRIKTPAWALAYATHLAEDAWVEVEVLMTPFSLAEAGLLPEVSHGVCPDCQLRLMQALDAGQEI